MPGTSADQLLAEQARVLEQIVRGAPLREVLTSLCRLAEAHALTPLRAAIVLADDAGCELASPAWSMPIMSSHDRVLGTFAIYFKEKRDPTLHERKLVEVLSRTAALAIERARSDRGLVEQARRAEFLNQLSATTQTLTDATDVMATTARMLAEHLDVDRCAYAEIEDERVFVITGDHPRNGVPSIVGRWEVSAFGPACVRAMRGGVPYVVEDANIDPRLTPELLAAYQATTIRAVICVPLHKNGRFTAAMAVHQKTPRQWTSREIELVTVVVARCWESLERTRVIRTRRAADRALAESRARLDYAVRLSGVGFWYCDLPFAELMWDARCKEHFFLPPDARVTIETFYERIHPEDRELTRQAIDASIEQRESYDVVYRTVDPATGAIKHIRALGGTAYAPDGTPTRFDGVTVDVTAQKRDEERLARVAAAALRIHSASTLDRVIDAVTEEARDIIGARDCVATLSPEPTLPRSEITRTPQSLAVPLVARHGDQLGEIYLSHKHVGAFTSADEAVLVQLAQIAAVAIENARLWDQLRDQDRRKDEFLATLAHELRNPLAPIRTGVQVIQRSPSEQGRVLAMMDRQLDHLVRMVDDLLDISRITLGKVDLKKAHVDLRTVLDSALETTRPLVEAGGHEIVVKLSSEPLPLDVDPTRMSQVFANLINNAARYTPGGGRISISAERSGSQLLVHVSDTGIGIPVEMLPRVFDMFTQVGRTIERTQGGLGIGLTLVRRLVEMHGGTVEAFSEGANTGCTFTVRMPLALQAEQAAPSNGHEPVHANTGLRIVVVDDNIDAAEMLSMLLEAGGNETRMAHNGPVALDVISEFRPDVVFLDIGLPDMNGYEVAERLRANAELRQPVLIALTGWGTDEDRRQAHAAGFDRHLVKPIDTAKLHDVLATARSDS